MEAEDEALSQKKKIINDIDNVELFALSYAV